MCGRAGLPAARRATSVRERAGAPSGGGEALSVVPELAVRATQLAEELDVGIVEETILLTVSLAEGHSPARRALEAVGVPLEDLRPRPGSMRSWPPGPPLPRVGWPVSAFSLLARAEGLAAALGAAEVEPDHLVLAALWEPTGVLSTRLWARGVRREAVVEELARLGGARLRAPLPPQGDADWDPPVYFPAESMNAVIAAVRSQLRSGDTPFGCNTVEVEGRRIGWIHGHPSLRLTEVVREVTGAEPLSPPTSAPSERSGRTPWGHVPWVAGAVVRWAIDEARRRHREACGDELVLLGLAARSARSSPREWCMTTTTSTSI